jgi:hypothetical protein
MVRFNTVVPLFKARKVFFPIERKTEPTIAEAITELSWLVSQGGFRSKKDDFMDTITISSCLAALGRGANPGYWCTRRPVGLR